MTQRKRKLVSIILALTMLLSLLSAASVGSYAASDSGITEEGGWLESAYVEWAPVSGASGYNAYVKSSTANDWTAIDDSLIRQYGDYWRVDAVGLKVGSYQIKVVPVADGAELGDKALTSGVLTVSAHNRNGYAHYNGSASGAYNDDGTLKSDAQVIYVTADTAKTCTATVNGAVQTGLQTILDAKQKKNATEPLCIRIIGLVELGDLDHISSSSEGLQIKGNDEYSSMNITIEGIGEDATISGFGMLIRNCKNVEIRNLGLMNFMDDGISVDTDNSNIWIHNCDFFYGQVGSDSDQAKGDGSLDTKKSQYITYSYNHFWDSGKVNLVGNGDDSVNYLTFHHNWYDHSDSRMPRVRCATVHVYNNFYDGVSKYAIGSTMDSDIFSENNYFLNTKYPMLISKQGTDIYGDSEGTFSGEDGGIIKSYGNVMVNATRFVSYADDSTEFDAYVASSRDEQVPSSVVAKQGGATYNNFDTASSFYTYDVESAAQAMETVKQYAGRINGGDFEWTFTASDNTDYEVNTALKAAISSYESSVVSIGGNGTNGDGGSSDSGSDSDGGESTVVPAGTQVHNFTTDGTTSSFFTITGNLSNSKGTVSYNGLTLTQCLKLETKTNISFTAETEGKLILVFNSENSKNVKIDGTKYTFSTDEFSIDLDAGNHTVTKADTANLFYMAFIVESEDDGGDNSGSTDNTEGENTGSDNTGGESTEGENTGGDNTGGDNSGSTDNTEGENTGSDNTGDNTGGENTGSENTGSDNTGGESTEGESTEGENNEKPDGDNTEAPEENGSEGENNEGESTEAPDTPDGEQNGNSDGEPTDELPEEKLNFFQRIWRAIISFFKRLFGGKAE